MSTKETLPMMSEEEILKHLTHVSSFAHLDVNGLIAETCSLIASLRTRLDAAEKELVLHNHRCEAAHNKGQAGMPQGNCQCLICAGFYEELTQLKAANAALVKDGERVDWLESHNWTPESALNLMYSVSIRQAIDAANAKGTQ